MPRQFAAEMLMDALHVRKREVTAPDAGLVRDDEQLEAGVTQPLQAGRRGRKNFHVFRPAQIIFFHDERAIAVEKNGPVHSGKLWLGYDKNGIEIFAGSGILWRFSF